MILISHRGNISGKISNNENQPDYVNNAIQKGYDVEIDVWRIEGDWYLGHDTPQYKVNDSYFFNDKLWIHCKNAYALELFTNNNNNNIKYFWHSIDDYTIVSNGKVWVFPGKQLLENSICCLPELGYFGDLTKCHAVCSDLISSYSNLFYT